MLSLSGLYRCSGLFPNLASEVVLGVSAAKPWGPRVAIKVFLLDF